MQRAAAFVLSVLSAAAVLLLCFLAPGPNTTVRVSTRQAHSIRPQALPLSRQPGAATLRAAGPSGNQLPLPVPAASGADPAACAFVVDQPLCLAWVASGRGTGAGTLADAGAPPLMARRCEADCHGRGVCNEETGVCACRAGYNGSACAGLNTRLCNGGKSDGLWHGSHCAGECDELTGLCWCPGKLGVRPLSESCQPARMTLDVYAALNLYTDIWEGTTADGATVLDPCPASNRSKQKMRKAQLSARVEELAHFPARRARVLQRYWFGTEGAAAPRVEISAAGVPHVPRSAGGGGGSGNGARRRAAASGGEGALHFKKPTARGTALGTAGPEAWCDATEPARSPRCACSYDGTHGALCEARHEAFCLNQCSGHGACDALGGFCHCERGFFGADCSLTSEAAAGGGRAFALHAGHAARRAPPRRPHVYVYELPRMTTLILQYRANGGMCTHRSFSARNETQWGGGWVYTSDVALHEWLLRSPHRVADGRRADFFYVPLYLSCAMNPVYDFTGPAPYSPAGYAGIPPRPVMAMRMALSALEQLRAELPYWNASGGADHLFLFSHDEGACWAPLAVAQRAIVLTHWGRTDARPRSSSRYPQDNWEQSVAYPVRAPWGERWEFGAGGARTPFAPHGSRRLIGEHPCFAPDKDVVLPVFAPPAKFAASPWLPECAAASCAADVHARRETLAYFSGNLAEHEPRRYSRGIRHRLRQAFRGKSGWMLVGNRGARYSADLASSQFCLVPPGGDGWSSRVDDAVRHGCIPVIIMDGVRMPFEGVLDYAAFALRVPEKDVEKLDAILRAVPPTRQRAMREAMRAVWTRFTYARSFVDDGFLPRPGLPRGFLATHPVAPLRRLIEGAAAAPDAFDTLMMVLHGRMAARGAERAGRQGGEAVSGARTA